MLLDASAVLAYLSREPGDAVVEQVILSGHARVSAVNHAEVLSKLSDWGMSSETAEHALESLGIAIEGFTPTHAIESGRLCTTTRNFGVSLGDRVCLATARQLELPVLTGDQPWLRLASDLGLKIESFRPKKH